LPYAVSTNDSAQCISNGHPCCLISAGARDVASSTARASSEATPGSGLSPEAVRGSIYATVSLVTHAAMAWGASVFCQHGELGSDALVVQPGGVLMPAKAKFFIALAVIPGLTILALGIAHWESADPLRFTIYLLLALIASTLKVRLPGVTGTLSLNFLFILMGISQMSFSETVGLGALATVVQCVWKNKTRPAIPQVLFNVAALTMAITSAHFMYHLPRIQQMNSNMTVLLALAACFFFLTNTVLVATVLSLVETKPFARTWQQCYIWSFPYYLIGAAVAGLVNVSGRHVGWETSLLILPIMYLIYLHYRLFVERYSTQTERIVP
jgi:hypothetical protein